MCGIAGFVDYSGKLDKEFIDNTIHKLEHRGPDDSGIYFTSFNDISLGLANRRLSIIDLSGNGHQPFHSSCGNYCLIFNGTIYNYKELRSELTALGISFASNSDTEVLLQSYITWPKEFLEKINGIFAFSIYDRIKNKLLLGRDKIGVKPLFYFFNGNTFLFGSELRTFLKQDKFPQQIDKEALNLYLQYAYFPAPFTILKDIFKVKPGEILEFDIHQKSLSKHQYWNLNPHLSIDEDITTILENVQKKLVESVQSRFVSDVPAGILLSGGYDSSTVAAIAQKHQKDRIKTFSIGFNEKDYDEARYAEKIADYIGTEHYSLYFDDLIIKELITTIGKIFDEPMGDSGAVPLLLAAKLAKPHVKVLLSAEGGDELFGGYPAYFKALKISRYSRILRIPENWKVNRYLNILGQKSYLHTYKAISQYFTGIEAKILTGLNADLSHPLESSDQLNNILNFDLHNYLPEDLLMKADRCMMHFGIENRDPLLDIHLVEYIRALPGSTKCPDNNPKFLLKQIAHQLIPKELLDRPKKGFSMPVGKWLSENLKDFTEEKIISLSKRGLLNEDMILSVFKKFQNAPLSYFARQVWILLALELWIEEWLD